jgi:hypothetical protein
MTVSALDSRPLILVHSNTAGDKHTGTPAQKRGGPDQQLGPASFLQNRRGP